MALGWKFEERTGKQGNILLESSDLLKLHYLLSLVFKLDHYFHNLEQFTPLKYTIVLNSNTLKHPLVLCLKILISILNTFS